MTRVGRMLCLVLFVLFASIAWAQPAPADERPNVLFFVTDDQRLADTMEVMPRTTKWFHNGSQSEGITGGTHFDNGVATTPLCCPSRASIFTGRFPHNHLVQMNQGGVGHFEQNHASSSLQSYLKNSGYHTGIMGRYFPLLNIFGYSPTAPVPGWTEWSLVNNAALSNYLVNEDGFVKAEWRYSTTYIKDRALEFLDDREAADGQPWFLYVAPTAPHGPHRPEPKYAGDDLPELDTSRAAFAEEDRRDKPPWVQGHRTDVDRMRHAFLAYKRQLKSVDDMVEAVMAKLKLLGEDQNTIAVFTSDNGYHWGEHGLAVKEKPYLESIEVPFFMRWPGHVAANHLEARPAGNIDLAPTVIDTVNDAQTGDPDIQPSPAMDGVSLVDASQFQGRRAILNEWCGAGPALTSPRKYFATGVFPTWSSIRTDRFQYIEWYRTSPRAAGDTSGGCRNTGYKADFNEVIFREYYDLRPSADPEQLTNLLGDDDTENDPPTAALAAELATANICASTTGSQSCIRTLPAEVKITSGPEQSLTSDTSARFAFMSAEPGSTFECKQGRPADLPMLAYTPCQSAQTYSGLVEGMQAFSVRVTSPSGATDTEDWTWEIESDTGPETRITSSPPKLSASRTATFDFTSSESGSQFECELDGPGRDDLPTGCTSPIQYQNLLDGTYTFRVRAIRPSDIANDETPAPYTWRIDATAPETRVTVRSQSPNRTSASFNLEAISVAAPDDPRDMKFDCKLDNREWEPCGTMGASQQSYDNLSSGQHTLRARAVDFAGNRDTVDDPDDSITFTIGPVQAFRTTPDLTWPDVTAGTSVNAIIPDNQGGWYVAGDFSEVGGLPRTDVVHIMSSHVVDPTFQPSTDGAVRALALSGTTLYLGGTFTQVNGQPRSNLAAVDTAGALTSWNPGADNTVHALAVPPPLPGQSAASTVFAAGVFRFLRDPDMGVDVARKRVAEIRMSDGKPTSWDASMTTGTLYALAVNERYVYVGGEGITTIGGKPRSRLGAVDRLDATGTDWNPQPDGTVFSIRLRQNLGGLDTALLAGRFTTIGSVPQTFAAEVNLADNGSPTTWTPHLSLGGSTATGSARDLVPYACPGQGGDIDADVTDPNCGVVVGGHFDTVKTGWPQQAMRNRLAETDRSTGITDDQRSGSATDWNPNLNSSVLVLSCWDSAAVAPAPTRCDKSSSRVLAVGGNFTEIGGPVPVARNRLAFFTAP